jgi:diacylglycerol kinase family enzyme
MVSVDNHSFERPHFVVNARSLRGRGGGRLEALRGAVHRVFPGAIWSLTSGPGDAAALARAAAAGGADLIVAVGGDGTINEVVNGILTARGSTIGSAAGESARTTSSATHGKAPALGILPAGSGSDFARSLAIPRDVARALAVLASGRRRRIDAGKIACLPLDAGAASDRTERYFINMGGCGASAQVAEWFNRRRIPGALGYAAAAALTTFHYRWPQVEIRTDDGAAHEVTLNMLFACNGEYCGGGMHVGRGASLDDGLLLVVVAAGIGRLRTMLEWPRLYGGHLARVRGVRVTSARRAEVRSEEDVLVDCDGEVIGRLPAIYEIVPAAITVCA